MGDLIIILVLIVGTATSAGGWTTNQFGENTYSANFACWKQAKAMYRKHPDVFNMKSISLACVEQGGGVQTWRLIPND